jgi:hypothetical protein
MPRVTPKAPLPPPASLPHRSSPPDALSEGPRSGRGPERDAAYFALYRELGFASATLSTLGKKPGYGTEFSEDHAGPNFGLSSNLLDFNP